MPRAPHGQDAEEARSAASAERTPPATPAPASAAARNLKSYADHFVHDDWLYTRQYDIVHIRRTGDYIGYDRPDRRLRRVLRNLVREPRSTRHLFRNAAPLPWYRRPQYWALSKAAMIRVGLRTNSHLPDGVLDGGGVITYWEETGEYLQYVQPSVGSLLADFLLAEPDHPHARLITAELDRIADGYAIRVRAGEVDGRAPQSIDDTENTTS